MFRIFFTEASVAEASSEPDYDAIMPYKCVTSDEAVRRALAFVRRGYIVWKIDGPNGYCVNRQRLEAAIAAADKKTGAG